MMGRRDQQPQRAGAGQRADHHVLRVATPAQLGQRHLADGRAGGRAGARHRREDGAARHVGVQQPPGQRLHPGRQALEHVLAEPRAEQDLAHPDEQRSAVSVHDEAEPQIVTAMASPAGREANSCMPIQATPDSVSPIQTPLAQDQEQRQDQQRGDGEITHCAVPPRPPDVRVGRAVPARVRRETRLRTPPCRWPCRAAESTAGWRRCWWRCRGTDATARPAGSCRTRTAVPAAQAMPSAHSSRPLRGPPLSALISKVTRMCSPRLSVCASARNPHAAIM